MQVTNGLAAGQLVVIPPPGLGSGAPVEIQDAPARKIQPCS